MIEKKQDGLVILTGHASLHCGLWVRCKARPKGYVTCVLTHRAIVKGDPVYRPLSNGNLRYQRMLAEEVEKRIDR